MDRLLEGVKARVNWVSLQVQCRIAKVRRMVELGSIYIKKTVTSEKIPARVLANSSAVGSASHYISWGTLSRKNLMKARLVCRSIRSVSWAIKKASS